MSTRPWMPVYWQDFIMDTLDLRPDELGTYFIMLLLAWRREEAGLPNDMDMLKRSLQACTRSFHGHSFNRIVPKILNRYWTLDGDNVWRNKRLTKERQRADKLSAKQKQNAEKRWSKTKDNNGLFDADAMPSQSQSQSQKKERKEERARGARLSPDWWPSEADCAYAEAKGLSRESISVEAEKFRNYWTAKSGSGATKLDWSATWQNWILKVKETNGHGKTFRQSLGDRANELAEQARRLERQRGFGFEDEPLGSH